MKIKFNSSLPDAPGFSKETSTEELLAIFLSISQLVKDCHSDPVIHQWVFLNGYIFILGNFGKLAFNRTFTAKLSTATSVWIGDHNGQKIRMDSPNEFGISTLLTLLGRAPYGVYQIDEE